MTAPVQAETNVSASEIVAGDVVRRLKTGQLMAVEMVHDDGRGNCLKCSWFEDATALSGLFTHRDVEFVRR